MVYLATLEGLSAGSCVNYSFLVIYGNNNSQIIIKEVKTFKTVKIFSIQLKEPCGGIAIDYEKELIFFAGKKKVYRIHLVDENGNREISGKGKLFLNKTVDHFEIPFYQKIYSDYEIQSLLFDDVGEMLYVTIFKACTHSRLIVKLDPEKGYVTDYPLHALANPSVLCNGMLYASQNHTIYNITVAALEHSAGLMKPLITLQRLSKFTIDKLTNRLFYTQHENILKVVEGNLATTPISKNRTRVVMADGDITTNIQSIDVFGKIVVWSSHDWNTLYIAGFNKKNNFISMRNVHVLDAKTNAKPFSFNNIMNIRTCF